MTAPANPFEQLAYNIALQIQDGMIVYVGTGLPMVGAILAKKTHAPNITLVYESGGQDPWEGPMPWSVGGAATYRRAPMSMEMAHSFAMAPWELDLRQPSTACLTQLPNSCLVQIC